MTGTPEDASITTDKVANQAEQVPKPKKKRSRKSSKSKGKRKQPTEAPEGDGLSTPKSTRSISLQEAALGETGAEGEANEKDKEESGESGTESGETETDSSEEEDEDEEDLTYEQLQKTIKALLRKQKEHKALIKELANQQPAKKSTSSKKQKTTNSTPAAAEQTMDDKIESLQKQMGLIQSAGMGSLKEIQNTLTTYSNEPLSAEIMTAEFPANFKYSSLSLYDEKSDPLLHCWQIKALIDLYPKNKIGLTRLFKTTLKDGAVTWYNSLPNGSINSWEELQSKFCAHYSHNRKEKVTRRDLNLLKRGPKETLRAFWARWKGVYSQITGMYDPEACTMFLNALDPNDACFRELAREDPQTIDELFRIVDAHVREEDLVIRSRGNPNTPQVSAVVATPAPVRNTNQARNFNGQGKQQQKRSFNRDRGDQQRNLRITELSHH